MMSMVSSFEYAIFLMGGALCLLYGAVAAVLSFFEKK